MPAEATPVHEHSDRIPDRPSGDRGFGLQAASDSDPTLRPTRSQGGHASVELVSLRFDRIEDRLNSLERMLSELIHSRCEPPTVGVDLGHQVQPVPSVQPETAVAQSQAEAPPRATAMPVWEQRGDGEELDVSVRDYIERLLKKDSVSPLHPSLQASQVAAIAPPVDSPRQDGDAQSPPAAWEEPGPEEVAVGVLPPAHRFEESPDATPASAGLVPLRPRPERDANLEAMRLVANLSATAAIRTYEKSQAARKTIDRLPLLLIGLVCGLMLLYSALSSGQAAMLVGAGVAFVGAALTAWQVLFIFFRWLAAAQPVRDP
jgi:hypothetical protein